MLEGLSLRPILHAWDRLRHGRSAASRDHDAANRDGEEKIIYTAANSMTALSMVLREMKCALAIVCKLG